MTQLINKIINEAASYEDGETGEDRCIELYCEDNNIDKDVCELAKQVAFERAASQAGIPKSVIKGEKKLSELVNKEYINYQKGDI